MTALLASLFGLAFIVSPYWLMPEVFEVRILLLALTIAMGAAWSHLSASSLQLRFDAKSWILFGVLLAGLLAINYKPLASAIPWRGDEDHHISVAMSLAKRFEMKWVLAAVLAYSLLLYLVWQKSIWAIPLGLLLVIGVVFVFLIRIPMEGVTPELLLRYPFVNYWFYAMGPMIVGLIDHPYYEAAYRIGPILSAIVLSWVFQNSLKNLGISNRLLWALTVATMPIVFYYSSILYLELPAAVLMLVVCLRIETLLADDYSSIRRNPAWYALILVGFIKETTIMFLLAFLVSRAVFSFIRGKTGISLRGRLGGFSQGNQQSPLQRNWIGELAIIFSILTPLLLYLFFRSFLATTRSFAGELSSIWDPSVYYTIGRSYLEQFGLFLIFFLLGCAVLVRRRNWSAVGFFLALFLSVPLFHAIDNNALSGYSRFNLFVLPPVLAGSSILLNRMNQRRKVIVVILAGATIAVNLLISPINLDGSKKPFWGNYLTDTSEHYYPYREAIAWLKEEHGDERILFAGMDYPYFFGFYFNQFGWYPEHAVVVSEDAKSQSEVLSELAEEAKRGEFEVVLYHVSPEESLPPQVLGALIWQQIFRNQAHSLVVYDAAD